jgi:hypothetical protein
LECQILTEIETIFLNLNAVQLTEAEFVAAYIISFLHKAYPKCLWLTGALPCPIQITSHVYPTVTPFLPGTPINQESNVTYPSFQQLNENEEGNILPVFLMRFC